MLAESEIRERALYCYRVFLQLSWLCRNESVDSSQYLEWLKRSSLGLGQDDFIKMTVEEALFLGEEDGGIRSLIALYEGFAEAYCAVLEISLDDLHSMLSPEELKKLSSEMGTDLSPRRQFPLDT